MWNQSSCHVYVRFWIHDDVVLTSPWQRYRSVEFYLQHLWYSCVPSFLQLTDSLYHGGTSTVIETKGIVFPYVSEQYEPSVFTDKPVHAQHMRDASYLIIISLVQALSVSIKTNLTLTSKTQKSQRIAHSENLFVLDRSAPFREILWNNEESVDSWISLSGRKCTEKVEQVMRAGEKT